MSLRIVLIIAFALQCQAAVLNTQLVEEKGKTEFLGTVHSKLTSNATLSERFHKQLEYELKPSQIPEKSKVTLSVIFVLGLGICGIDRCFMGQMMLGTCKALTLGGLGFWALVDSIVILVNCLQKEASIDMVGFKATFPKKEIETAFTIALVGFLFHLLSGAMGGHNKSQ
jgi:TM2 domain-containing membrane protein YozV